ncbi:EAL domain-containing protein [Gallaecimonas kandeliae]|uniref:EAL domain-containing protein n=1 Tax=Gallaecimonas kandeliae TaxID=3029055 RepID=UPI002649DE7F|nr:EAL domain-containing protein [Gallaecimonas kandeliae]WKE67017.1 EAL domain-containing protein [Gallaecimonas kandeliae]
MLLVSLLALACPANSMPQNTALVPSSTALVLASEGTKETPAPPIQNHHLFLMLGALGLQLLIIGLVLFGIARWRRLQQESRRLSRMLGKVLDAADAFAIIATDAGGLITHFNRGAELMLGYKADELVGLATPLVLFLEREVQVRAKALGDELGIEAQGFRALVELAERQGCDSREWTLMRKDGRTLPVSLVFTTMRDPDGLVTGYLGVAQDITEQSLAASVFANSYEGIMITDADNLIVDVNPAFSRITGYKVEEVRGKKPSLLSSGRQGEDFYQAMWQSLVDTGAWRGEIWNRRKSGEVYAEILAISVVRDATGRIQHHIGVFSDISQQKAQENELAHIANYDTLTGLPNRRLLNELLGRSLAQADRKGQGLAICFIDLDGFKPINDQYGHQTGDMLLVEVAKRLQKTVRQMDVVARLGGDEFVLLLTELDELDDLESLRHSLDRLLAAVSAPFTIEGVPMQVSASIGVSLYPQDKAAPEILLRRADQAMYRAKQSGKNQYQLFDLERDRQLSHYQSWLNRLETALTGGELCLYYQPKINLINGQVEGAEALLRWQHPSEGLKSPGEFLSHLLGTKLELRLGRWVLATALAQLAAWHRAGLSLSLSVNISAAQLLQPDFAEELAALLDSYPDVSPSALELELVETAALTDLGQAARTLTHCHQLGIHTALDDFGTGYASLTYLRRLPVDRLKVDQSFVQDMLEDPNDLSIVENIIQMAKAFNRDVIAEGVENQSQARALLQLGCSRIQGFGVARPMSAERFWPWLHRWQQRPRWLAPKLPPYHHQLPLLTAITAHRLWVDGILAQVAGKEPEPLELSSNHCPLGLWYHTAGMARYGHLDSFLALEALHDSSHEAAKALLGADETSRAAKTKALLAARDAVINQLALVIKGESPKVRRSQNG